MAPPSDLNGSSASTRLGFQMQAALKNIRWTYSILWQFSQERLLVWNNGFYNGDTHTRKVTDGVDSMRSHEEVCVERSEQLREMFKSLSARGSNREHDCTSTVLVPEDLTDAEWFYLVSMSYQFKPSMGLPGLALQTGTPVWLNNANKAEDSKNFERKLLAKTSGIKTVVCFPFTDCVLEFGITEQVQEDPDLIEHIASFFIDLF